MTYFVVGDILVATCDAQKLVKHGRYLVRGVNKMRRPFGSFCSYRVSPEHVGGGFPVDCILVVCNLHILARKVGHVKLPRASTSGVSAALLLLHVGQDGALHHVIPYLIVGLLLLAGCAALRRFALAVRAEVRP